VDRVFDGSVESGFEPAGTLAPPVRQLAADRSFCLKSGWR